MEKDLNLDGLLEVLGNPTRRIILAKLAKVPHTASELAKSLDISRQAVHTQLKILASYGLVEQIDPEARSSAYRITSNLHLRIDLTPDYFSVEHEVSENADSSEAIKLADIGCEIDYKKLKNPKDQLRFLGEKIKEIEQSIQELEYKRVDLVKDKECVIRELKEIMAQRFNEQMRQEQPNLEKEIFYTMFYDPLKYFKRINIENLLDDMFFSNMDLIKRDQQKIAIKHMLRDLSNIMGFLHEDDDSWFFDF